MLKEIKFYFENMFAQQWTETDIHFAGQEFDAKKLGIKRWVNPYYVPTRTRNFGMGEGAKIYYGDFYIVCWDTTDSAVMELGDKVAEFVESNIDKSVFKIKGYDVVDHGWDVSNKPFIIISFGLETIRGSCEKIHQLIRVTHNNTQLSHNGAIIVN